MSFPKQLEIEHKGIGEWSILHGYRGSIAHGMYMPNTDPNSIDDKDTMAICVPPLEYYYGLSQYGPRGTKEYKFNEWDIVVYEARKFISLLEKGNPNVLSLLWLNDKHYIKKTSAGQKLINSRGIFVGKHVYHSFVGYAYSQLHRLTKGAYRGYMGEKRKALVKQYGYDTKNATHLIRLLKMGMEFLVDGHLQVERQDAPYLLDIKRGKWSLDEVQKEADRLFRLTEEAFMKSKLPIKPDHVKVNRLCVGVIEEAMKQ